MNINVSIIIVTYNSENIIMSCLLSLLNQTYKDFEIIIVDNASTDLTCNQVTSFENSNIKLIRSSVNEGFTGGNIKGLNYVTDESKYIALLNPDTEAVPTWLGALLYALDKHNDVGICASKLIAHDTNLIDSAGDGCTTTCKGYKRGEGLPDNMYNKSEYVFGACGGAMLMRRKVIESIGFLDNDFFLIHEDTDFCFRAMLHGWKTLFVPEAIVYHKVRSSIGKMSDMAVYYSIRNSQYVWFKNMPTRLMFKYLPQKIIQDIACFYYFVVKHHKHKPYFQATFDFIQAIPRLLKIRRHIQNNILVNLSAVDQTLTSVWDQDLMRQKKYKLFN